MQVTVSVWNERGDDTLLEYDPAIADMEQINAAIDRLETQLSGRAFSLATGEAVERITPDTRDVIIVRAIAGG